MGSRFENFDIGRALASLLKIKGLKNFPTDLHTDSLMPVVDVSGLLGINVATPDSGLGTPRSTDSGDLDKSTLIQANCDLVGTGFTGSGDALPNGLLDAYRFDLLEVVLTFNAAGAIAFNGKTLDFRIGLTGSGDGSMDPNLIHNRAWVTVATGKLIYAWTMWQSFAPNVTGPGWNGGFRCAQLVKNSDGSAITSVSMGVQISATDNSSLPANTFMRVKAIARRSTNGIVPKML